MNNNFKKELIFVLGLVFILFVTFITFKIGNFNKGIGLYNKELQVEDKTIKQGDTINISYVTYALNETKTGASLTPEEIQTLDKISLKERADKSIVDFRKKQDFLVGDKNVLPELSKAFIGMKKGESKTITLTPDKAFGEKLIKIWIEKDRFLGQFERKIAKDQLADVVESTIKKNILAQKVKDISVGKKFNFEKNEVTITSCSKDSCVLSLDNKQGLFYKVKKEIGTSRTLEDGTIVTITDIDDKEYTLTFKLNDKKWSFKERPKLEIGSVGILKNGDQIKVLDIQGNQIQIEAKNPHALAGKTIQFVVTVNDIIIRKK